MGVASPAFLAEAKAQDLAIDPLDGAAVQRRVRALLARKDIVDVLHLAGAEDAFIARLFQRRFWTLGLKAGSAGSVAALAVTAMIVFSAQSSSAPNELLPKLSLDFWDLAILVVSPVIGGLAARFAARLTVSQSLKSAL